MSDILFKALTTISDMKLREKLFYIEDDMNTAQLIARQAIAEYQKEQKLLIEEDVLAVVNDIAQQMHDNELSFAFIVGAGEAALQYEGVYDLMKMWRDEVDAEERFLIQRDIEDLLRDIHRKKANDE